MIQWIFDQRELVAEKCAECETQLAADEEVRCTRCKRKYEQDLLKSLMERA